MKKATVSLLLCLASSSVARASDDNILLSNMYTEGDSYWNVASSDDRQLLFDNLARDIGVAVSHKNLAPGETLGVNGFEVGLDTTVAFVSKGEVCSTAQQGELCQKESDRLDAWRVMDADHRLTFGNALIIPTLRIRKGLPFSTEAGIDLSYLSFSHQTAVSGYGRIALHEGMWDRLWRVMPDVAFTLAGTKYLGNEQLDVSSLEWNLTLGWTFPVAGVRDSYVGTFSPYIGLGRMYITATPQGPLPERLDSLEGQTGLQSREVVADEATGVRAVAWNDTFRPLKSVVGIRAASGRFRLAANVELAHIRQVDSESGSQVAAVRPTVNFGVGFLY